jgi:hypothetical protein
MGDIVTLEEDSDVNEEIMQKLREKAREVGKSTNTVKTHSMEDYMENLQAGLPDEEMTLASSLPDHGPFQGSGHPAEIDINHVNTDSLSVPDDDSLHVDQPSVTYSGTMEIHGNSIDPQVMGPPPHDPGQLNITATPAGSSGDDPIPPEMYTLTQEGTQNRLAGTLSVMSNGSCRGILYFIRDEGKVHSPPPDEWDATEFCRSVTERDLSDQFTDYRKALKNLRDQDIVAKDAATVEYYITDWGARVWRNLEAADSIQEELEGN